MEVVAVVILIVVILAVETLIFAKNMFRNFRYTATFSKNEVFEGESVELVETVLNGKELPIPSLRAEITASRWLEFSNTDSIQNDEIRFVPSFFMLKGYQKITRRWDVTCTRRGVHGVRSIILISNDLLGLKTLSQPVYVNSNVVVLPTSIDLGKYFVNPRLMQGDFVVPRALVEDPFFVSGVRQYAPTDSLKQIHWSATAKTGEIMVRNYDYTNKQNMTVLLNMQSRESERGKVGNTEALEMGIKVCAALFEQAHSICIGVRFASNGSLTENAEDRNMVFTREYSSEEGSYELLRTLAYLKLRSTRDIYDLLHEVESQELTSDICLVTCYINRYIEEFCERMFRLHRTIVRVLVLGFDKGEEYGEYMEVYYLNEELRNAAQAKDEAEAEREVG